MYCMKLVLGVLLACAAGIAFARMNLLLALIAPATPDVPVGLSSED